VYHTNPLRTDVLSCTLSVHEQRDKSTSLAIAFVHNKNVVHCLGTKWLGLACERKAIRHTFTSFTSCTSLKPHVKKLHAKRHEFAEVFIRIHQRLLLVRYHNHRCFCCTPRAPRSISIQVAMNIANLPRS
jgi:hypothetical protein